MPFLPSSSLLRASFVRSSRRYAGLPRRFATGGGLKTELQGVQDNAFNRERAAVKAHAAATSGESVASSGGDSALILALQICGGNSRSSEFVVRCGIMPTQAETGCHEDRSAPTSWSAVPEGVPQLQLKSEHS